MPIIRANQMGSGVREMHDLWGLREEADRVIKGIAMASRTKNAQIIIFSDTVNNNNGKRIADFIVRNKLGDIIESPASKSRNTGAMIQTWMWSVWHKALQDWSKANPNIVPLKARCSNRTWNKQNKTCHT
jgi:hypothetical protein